MAKPFGSISSPLDPQNYVVTGKGCHEWKWKRDRDGYGRVRWEGKTHGVHRIAFYLTRGRWPQICRHTCDNPPCCNPDHLLDGSHKDNQQDMTERGRGRLGLRNGWAKLTDEQVQEIRDLCAQGDLTKRAIAARYGVSNSYISKIALNQIRTNF